MFGELLVSVIGGLAGDSTLRQLPRNVRDRRRLKSIQEAARSQLLKLEVDLPDEALSEDDLHGVRYALVASTDSMAAAMFAGVWAAQRDVMKPRYRDDVKIMVPDVDVDAIVQLVDATEVAVEASVQYVVNAQGHVPRTTQVDLANLNLLAAIESHLRTFAAERSVNQPARHLANLAVSIRQAARRRSGTIRPPDSERYEGLPIEEIYVSPSLRTPDGDTTVEHIVGDDRHSLIVGDPGSGKSTLTAYIEHSLSAPPDLESPDAALVLRTEIRATASDIADGSTTILDALAREASSLAQVRVEPEILSQLMMSVRTVVMFDGLDEVLDLKTRREIVEAIESFAMQWDSVRAIVTSRAIGYAATPLSDAFTRHEVRPFSVRQTAEYSRRWFDHYPITGVQARVAADSLVSETETIADIRSNPLLLSLLCILYRGRQYIPENRAEVYERCARLLYRDWDRDRKIVGSHSFDAALRGSLEDIAIWFSHEPRLLVDGASESEMLSRVASFLVGHEGLDAAEARTAGAEFIDFCTGRLWVLTKVGVAESGEAMLGFVHRTFFEYFAAEHLAKTSGSVSRVVNEMLGYWDDGLPVVAELAGQMRSTRERGAADKILLGIAARSAMLPPPSHAEVLLTLQRGLQPRPDTTRAVTQHLFHLLGGSGYRAIGESLRAIGRKPDGLLIDVARSSMFGVRTVVARRWRPDRSSIAKSPTRPLRDGSDPPQPDPNLVLLMRLGDIDRASAAIAMEEAISILSSSDGLPNRVAESVSSGVSLSGRSADFWGIVLRSWSEARDITDALAVRDEARMVLSGVVPLSQFIEFHGPEAMFIELAGSQSTLCAQLCDANYVDSAWKPMIWFDLGRLTLANLSGSVSQDAAGGEWVLDVEVTPGTIEEMGELGLEDLSEFAGISGYRSPLKRLSDVLQRRRGTAEIASTEVLSDEDAAFTIFVGVLAFRLVHSAAASRGWEGVKLSGSLEPLGQISTFGSEFATEQWMVNARAIGFSPEAAEALVDLVAVSSTDPLWAPTLIRRLTLG